MFLRMRRQHGWELDRSLERAIEAHGGGRDNDKSSQGVGGRAGREEGNGDAPSTAPAAREAEDGVSVASACRLYF